MNPMHTFRAAVLGEGRLFRAVSKMRQFRRLLVVLLGSIVYLAMAAALTFHGVEPWNAPTFDHPNGEIRNGAGSILFRSASGEEFSFDGERHFRREKGQWVPYDWPGFVPEEYHRAMETFAKSVATTMCGRASVPN